MYEDKILRYLEWALDKGAKYADVRIEMRDSTVLTIRDGTLREMVGGIEVGAGIRILRNCWGFASTNDMGDAQGAFERAFKLSGLRGEKISLKKTKPARDDFTIKVKKSPKDVDIEIKKKIVMDAYRAAKSHERVKSVTVNYADSIKKKFFANTDGALISSLTPSVMFSIMAVAREGNLLQEARERTGAVAGFEYIEKEDIYQTALRASERSVKLLDAKSPPAGKYPVVMNPTLAGVFMHEALGHAAEADHILLGESILAGKSRWKIASELLTVCDNPTIQESYGFYKYDDEGVPSGNTVVIEKGVLKTFLQSRESAYFMRADTTGNARAESYADLPIVRMSNTVIEKGDRNFEEIAEIKEGIYAKGMRGGQVDTVRGEFQFSAEEGFLIKNGEIKKMLRNVSLSGRTLDALKGIDAVGKDFSRGSIGQCGKQGQSVPVAEFGPHVRVTELLVGGVA
jgi:TldD protein